MANGLSQIVNSQINSDAEIAHLRGEICHRMVAQSPTLKQHDFDAIQTKDLARLFSHYDDLFFQGSFGSVFEELDRQLTFRLSKRMTSTGGTTSFHKRQTNSGVHNHFEIAVSSTLLFNTRYDFRNHVRVGGLRTTSRLDALLRIFEHELIHLAELCIWEKSSCSAKRYKSIIYRLFGHIESNHQLVTPIETAKRDLGIEIGDRVGFQFEGRRLDGYVNQIRRRATVLVEHNDGELYQDGKKYIRYYVPLGQLARIS